MLHGKQQLVQDGSEVFVREFVESGKRPGDLYPVRPQIYDPVKALHPSYGENFPL